MVEGNFDPRGIEFNVMEGSQCRQQSTLLSQGTFSPLKVERVGRRPSFILL